MPQVAYYVNLSLHKNTEASDRDETLPKTVLRSCDGLEGRHSRLRVYYCLLDICLSYVWIQCRLICVFLMNYTLTPLIMNCITVACCYVSKAHSCCLYGCSQRLWLQL